MNALVCLLTLWAGGEPQSSASTGDVPALVVVVVGAGGAPEYGQQFGKWADRWVQAADAGGATCVCIGRDEEALVSDRDLLRKTLAESPPELETELWLVLIGHGTFDGREAKFNLRGPDVSAHELREWLAPVRRPVAVINCASSSGPFLNTLSASNRVVVTATKSGFEQNFARFGDYLSQAVGRTDADLDKDGQTSLLEAFLIASRRTEEFYETDGRLMTEHALLDDNGDGQGIRADWFHGIRPVRRPADGAEADGWRAHQFHLVRSPQERSLSPELRRRRDKLELQVIQLREKKDQYPEDEYYRRLEDVLVELARLYEQAAPESPETANESLGEPSETTLREAPP